MEANCCVIFDMPNQSLRDKTAEFLSEDKRPVFEDEVEPQFHPLFNALEHTEYADDLQKVGQKTIHAYFFMGGDFDEDVEYFFECLHKSGATLAIAAIEADDFEGLVHMDRSGYIKTLGKDYRKLMKFYDVTNDEDEEEPENDLVDTYRKLELVKQKLLSENSTLAF